jgi:tripartite-type tricarboxylate transporter receptor subunit TctC
VKNTSNGVEFVIDKYEGYKSLQTKNPKLQMVAASCPTRLPQEPKIKTLKEQGITAPYIFNITIAHRHMQEGRRKAISIILHNATQRVGEKEIFNLSAMRPPQFDNITADEFYTFSVKQVKALQAKYKDKINSSK